jgi:hypothetical protein
MRGTTYHERKALQDGYTRQGAYSWNNEEMKQRAAELRKRGNKAKVIYIPADPLSRSGGGGYAVMWIESEVNKAERIRVDKLRRLNQKIATRDRMKAELDALQVEIDALAAEVN